MIKDVFTLSKNSIWVKMMKYIWNLDYYDFSHMCPFFWLSLANAFIIIPFFIVRSIIVGIFKFVVWIGKFIPEHKSLSDRAYDFLNTLSMNESTKISFFEKIFETKVFGTDCLNRFDKKVWDYMPYYLGNQYWDFHLKRCDEEKDLIDKQEQLRAIAREKERQRLIKRKDRVNSILKIVKPIGQALLYIIGTLSVLGLTFGLYKLIVLIGHMKHKVWVNFGESILVLLIIAIGMLILYGIIKLIIYLFQTIDINLSMSCKTKNNIGSFFKALWLPFYYIGKGIGGTVMFIINMIKQNCPAINWKD